MSDNPEEVGVSQNTTQLSSVDNSAVLAPLSLVSCLQKFHNDAKMNSSEKSTAGTAPEEFSALNAQVANLKVKKTLMIADNIRNDETVAITATKATLDTDLATASQDLKSQDLQITLRQQGGDKFLCSVTSLTIRLPAFDHVEHASRAYMRIKSDEFLFAKTASTTAGASSHVVITPTDDARLKALIMPVDCLLPQSQTQTFFEAVQATLATLQIIEMPQKKVLFLPSFELKVEAQVSELEGLRLSETHRVKEAKIRALIELAHCKQQEEGLILPAPSATDSVVIDKEFVFGKWRFP